MEAPKDVVALFHSAFHPTQGNIVDFSLKIREDVSLDGVEFSSLPSGLHLVDQDVIHFTKDGLCGIAVFRRRRTKEDGLRGVRLGAVGVLIGSAPRARPWLHLPHLKRLAAHLEDTPEDWAPLTEYYESHRQPDIIPAESSVDISDIWNGWEHELATASPNHPLHHLPCLLHAFGPSIMTLFRYVLARRRVLIYTRVPVPQSRSASINSIPMRFSESSRNEEGSRGNSIDQTAAEAGAAPVVEPACVLARVAADICFGWRSETDVPGLGAVESAIPVLGMVGLDAIERLGEESMKRSGWIACTTERIFLEKPYLYDLVVDLSPSLLAHSPTNASLDDKPVLSTSVPAGSSSPSLPQSFKLAPTRPTFSDMRIFEKIDRALYSQPGCSHQHQAQPQHPANQSTASLGIGYGHEDEEGWVVWDRWGCTPNDGMLITGNRQSCAAGMNTGPCSSGLNGHVQGQSEVSESPVSTTTSTTPPASASTGIKFWIDPWRIYEDVCMFCMGVCSWVGLTRPAPTNEGIRLSGPDTTLTRTSQPTARPAPTTHMSADQRRSQRRAHVLELMTIFHKYAAFLHARLGDIVDSHDALPQSPRKAKSSSMSKASFKSAFSKPLLFKEEDRGTLVLTSKDLVALDLSPLSASDAQFVEWLAECLIKSARKSERKVVVKRTWRDMVVAVVGSPW